MYLSLSPCIIGLNISVVRKWEIELISTLELIDSNNPLIQFPHFTYTDEPKIPLNS